jgi:hypothetical protein
MRGYKVEICRFFFFEAVILENLSYSKGLTAHLAKAYVTLVENDWCCLRPVFSNLMWRSNPWALEKFAESPKE